MKKWTALFLSLCTAFMMLVVPLPVAAQTTVTDITDLSQITGSGSYRLSQSVTLTDMVTIPDGMEITIDLNGQTITGASGKYLIENHGILTVNGNGTLNSQGPGGIRNYGSLTLNGGTINIPTGNYGGGGIFNRDTGTLIINQVVVNTDYYALYNNGDCLINNGEFHSTSSNRAGSGNWAYCISNNHKMTIKNATVTGIQGAVASSSGTLTIYNGNFSTKQDDPTSFYALYVAGERGEVSANIYGGTYSSPKYAAYIGNDNTNGDGGLNLPAVAYISGGSFTGGTGALLPCKNTSSVSITGGTYNTDITSLLTKCYQQDSTGAIKEAHSWDQGKVTTPATAQKEGVMTYTCSVCQETKTSVIPKVDPGEVIPDISISQGAPQTAISADKEALLHAVLTSDEQKLVESGTDIRIILNVRSADHTVSDEIRQIIEKNLGSFTLGQHLDLSMTKMIGSQQTDVTQLNSEIPIVIQVPEELQNGNENVKRSFAVIRVHLDDKTGQYLTTALPDIDDNDETVTIMTDCFSAYALAYQDAESKDSAVTETTTNAETLDHNQILLWAGLSLVSLTLVSLLLSHRRKLVKK